MSGTDPNFYFSSVKGHLVTRFGTGLLIGATRGLIEKAGDVVDPSKITWDEDEIIKVTPEEYAPYRREYTRAVRDGALKVRTGGEFEAVNKARADKADADAKAAAKAEAEAAAKAKKSEPGKKE